MDTRSLLQKGHQEPPTCRWANTHLKVDTCWWAGCLPHSPWGQEYPVCITCAHTHATLSIPQTPAEATNASLLSYLPQSLYRRQEIVWLQTAFIACASLTAWSYKWPSRSRFWWACVHWGTDDAHHAGPGLDPCHEGRTHLWVNSAHPCPDTVNFTWKKTKQNSMSPVIHPTSRPCALHRAFSSKSFVLQPNWLTDATYGTYSVKWVLCVLVSLLLVVIPSSLFTSTAQRKSTFHQSTGGLIMHCFGKCDIYKEDWCE